MFLRKATAGAAPGFTWHTSGEVVEVPDELGQELLEIPGAGFEEVAAPPAAPEPAPETDAEAAAEELTRGQKAAATRAANKAAAEAAAESQKADEAQAVAVTTEEAGNASETPPAGTETQE